METIPSSQAPILFVSPSKPHPSWPHAPVHRLDGSGVFIVTAGTYQKQRLLNTPEKLDLMLDALFSITPLYGWQLEAWAVLSNHYHFVGRTRGPAESLRTFVKHLHVQSARALNALDNTQNRKVWFSFWDTRLTYEKSYLARLHYVHQNPVHHRVAGVANQYPWCSAAWFERVTTPAMVKTIYGFKIDQLNVRDDF